MSLLVKLTRLPHGEGLPAPAYQTAGAAGLDLPAAVPADAPLIIPAGEWRLAPTGLAMAIPPGFEGQVRPRSGLALRHGVTVLNAPGTIDSDYRGEVAVVLVNHGPRDFIVTRGDRIAQLVFTPVMQARLEFATELGGTMRGAGGYGSTGL
jgi:dUTP pyrophosphatase